MPQRQEDVRGGSDRLDDRENELTKRYDDPIEVTPDPAQDGAPLSFRWRGRRYDVDQWLMTWREAGEWWHQRSSRRSREQDQRSSRRSREQDQRSSRRSREQDGRITSASDGHREQEFFRVVARPVGAMATGDLDADGFMQHPGAVYDVYLDRVRSEWRLARVWD